MENAQIGDVVRWSPGLTRAYTEVYQSEGPFIVVAVGERQITTSRYRSQTCMLSNLDGSILAGNHIGPPSEWNDYFGQWAFVKDDFLTAVHKRKEARNAAH